MKIDHVITIFDYKENKHLLKNDYCSIDEGWVASEEGFGEDVLGLNLQVVYEDGHKKYCGGNVRVEWAKYRKVILVERDSVQLHTGNATTITKKVGEFKAERVAVVAYDNEYKNDNDKPWSDHDFDTFEFYIDAEGNAYYNGEEDFTAEYEGVTYNVKGCDFQKSGAYNKMKKRNAKLLKEVEDRIAHLEEQRQLLLSLV